MKRFWFYVVYAICALAVECTWLSHFPQFSAQPDFLFVAVAALAFSVSWTRALPLVLLLGALQDAALPPPFGISPLCYALVYFGMRAVISQISLQGWWSRLVWVAVMSIAEKLLRLCLFWALMLDTLPWHVWLTMTAVQAALDGVLGVLLLPWLLPQDTRTQEQ